MLFSLFHLIIIIFLGDLEYAFEVKAVALNIIFNY